MKYILASYMQKFIMAAKRKGGEEAINNATKDVLEGNLSVRRAIVYILHDCISGKVSGAVSYVIMDEEEEKELVEFYWDVQRLSHIKLVFARPIEGGASSSIGILDDKCLRVLEKGRLC